MCVGLKAEWKIWTIRLGPVGLRGSRQRQHEMFPLLVAMDHSSLDMDNSSLIFLTRIQKETGMITCIEQH